MQKTAILIPCYNEELRLKAAPLEQLIRESQADLYLVNDGSKDGTVSVINAFASQHPGRCFLIDYQQNSGKANAIYKAMNEVYQKGYDFIGYFDADFSTPPSEVLRLMDEMGKGDYRFLFGSRVLLLNSGIRRKLHRHIIGRIIITIINFKFKLRIYDTQCGAKIFSKEIIPNAFATPFKTSWLFDVEIFVRLKQQNLLQFGKEVPVYEWVDVDGSKLGWQSALQIFRELYLLNRNYSLTNNS